MRPLEGIKVVDLTSAMAGPFCTMLLSDLGADVVKVESPEGDHAREWGPPFYGEKYSAYFTSVNRGKKSIVVDLKREEGRDIVRRLAAVGDVFVESFRPGVAGRLGLDYGSLSGVNPRLVYCSISGFGQWGPYRDYPGYDIVALAMSGLMDLTGEPDGEPVKFGVPIADIVTGLYCSLAVVSALRYRDLTGRGVYIDLSLLDSSLSILTHQAAQYFASGETPRRLGSAHPNIAPYQAFRAGDGRYFIVAVGNDRLWERFCEVIGRRDLAGDPRFRTNSDRVANREELARVLGEVFSRDAAARWVELLLGNGIPAAPILDVREALETGHVKARNMLLELVHPSAGRIKAVNHPLKVPEWEGAAPSPPPLLGEHTVEVLRGLGLSDAEIRSLLEKGVVRAP